MHKKYLSIKKFFFTVSFLLLTSLCSDSSGQSTCTAFAAAGNDTVLCAPATIRLRGSTNAPASNIRSILWQPAAGLNNPAVLSPTANITSSVTYHLKVTATSDSNMIINGNFNAGATGFTTLYVPGTGGTYGLLSTENEYAISTNPANTHVNFQSFGDHTSGTGNMMVINGASIANVAVWCVSIAVLPNTNYSFAAWVASCVTSNPARLQFSINGNLLGTPFNAPATAGTWSQFFQNWNSGASTVANICIVNQNIQVGGNDFALDDISFRQICDLEDSVVITLVNPSLVHLGNDTVLCSGQQLVLDATTAGATAYLWSTGETSASVTVNSENSYTVTALINGVCPSSDSMYLTINNYPQVTLGNDTFLCRNASFVLNAFSPDATSYHWNNGGTSSSQTVSKAGKYRVDAANGTCISSDSITVSILQLPVFDIGNDTSLCIPDSVVLKIPLLPGFNFTWDDGSTLPQKSVSKEGSYWLEIEDSGCTSRDYITITSGDCGNIFIPNSFTPNGDGINDAWFVFPFSVVTMETKLFNRWGEIIFTADSPDFLWQGNYKGQFVEKGIYNYLITGTYISGNEYTFRGKLCVIR